MQSTSVNHDEFRNFITEQTCYLRMACERLKKDMEESTDIPEDLIGDINVIVGQSELLIKERFTQFASLIDDSEFKRSEKEITLEDLQGFWDIVMIQIEKMTQKIDDLKQLKKNNWKCPVKKPVLKHIENIKMVSKVPKVKNFPATGKPKIRSHILALRKEMKLKNKMNTDIIIPTFEKDKENITLTTTSPSKQSINEGSSIKKFEAGFFNIYSPIRSPKKPKNTPRSTQSSSKRQNKRLAATPDSRKDYTPCARVTRSMKRSMEMSKNTKLAL
ncbi:UNVERIFIED_CONTAM: hypothetical protein RMT77_017283 [Armadillidium vulgare]